MSYPNSNNQPLQNVQVPQGYILVSQQQQQQPRTQLNQAAGGGGGGGGGFVPQVGSLPAGVVPQGMMMVMPSNQQFQPVQQAQTAPSSQQQQQYQQQYQQQQQQHYQQQQQPMFYRPMGSAPAMPLTREQMLQQQWYGGGHIVHQHPQARPQPQQHMQMHHPQQQYGPTFNYPNQQQQPGQFGGHHRNMMMGPQSSSVVVGGSQPQMILMPQQQQQQQQSSSHQMGFAPIISQHQQPTVVHNQRQPSGDQFSDTKAPPSAPPAQLQQVSPQPPPTPTAVELPTSPPLVSSASQKSAASPHQSSTPSRLNAIGAERSATSHPSSSPVAVGGDWDGSGILGAAPTGDASGNSKRIIVTTTGERKLLKRPSIFEAGPKDLMIYPLPDLTTSRMETTTTTDEISGEVTSVAVDGPFQHPDLPALAQKYFWPHYHHQQSGAHDQQPTVAVAVAGAGGGGGSVHTTPPTTPTWYPLTTDQICKEFLSGRCHPGGSDDDEDTASGRSVSIADDEDHITVPSCQFVHIPSNVRAFPQDVCRDFGATQLRPQRGSIAITSTSSSPLNSGTGTSSHNRQGRRGRGASLGSGRGSGTSTPALLPESLTTTTTVPVNAATSASAARLPSPMLPIAPSANSGCQRAYCRMFHGEREELEMAKSNLQSLQVDLSSVFVRLPPPRRTHTQQQMSSSVTAAGGGEPPSLLASATATTSKTTSEQIEVTQQLLVASSAPATPTTRGGNTKPIGRRAPDTPNALLITSLEKCVVLYTRPSSSSNSNINVLPPPGAVSVGAPLGPSPSAGGNRTSNQE